MKRNTTRQQILTAISLCGIILTLLAACTGTPERPDAAPAPRIDTPVVLERDAADTVAPNLRESIADVRHPDVKIHVGRGQTLAMQTEGLFLTAVDAAVQHEADYSVTSLVAEELPPLPQGMVNMTAATAGYRLLPGGEHFLPYAELRMTYDPERLPQGYTPDDIYTSFYDTATLAWVRLERVGVDTVNHEIVSLTTHFTDFINELLKAPEMPETQAFVPTAMTDLEAVSPMDGMTMIQPPTANNNGTANVSYPLAIPAGRGGMQPNLALTYSSTGGSGWLGVGWDIPVSSITLDTRWGVPRYDETYETEIYLLDGEQLVAKDGNGAVLDLPHRTNSQTPRSALGNDVHFFARTGDAHDSIVRHGDNPKTYWWEVVDRNGLTHYYGRYHQSGRSMDFTPNHPVVQGALPSDVTYDSADNVLRWPLPTSLSDDKGNIARWVLTESRDLYGNTVRYYYDKATVRNRRAVGRQIYLDSISYTGHNDTDGHYTVVFCRTGNITPDVPEVCTNGFKEITDQLLNNVYLKCGDSIQTIWHFELENGASTNYKNRLTSVTKIDSVDGMSMRGLIDTMCHCIRQDEDEFATAGTNAPYVYLPNHDSVVYHTVYVPNYRMLWEKCCITDTHELHGSTGNQLYNFVHDTLYYTFYNTTSYNDSLFYALYDSIYFQASYDSAGFRWYRYRDGYEARVDTVRIIVFDSTSIPHHLRPLSSFNDLGYAGTTTTFEYYNAPGSKSLFGDEKTIDLSDSDKRLHGFFLSNLASALDTPYPMDLVTWLRSRATGLGLSTSSGWNIGGAATVGLGPVVCLTNASLGGNYTRSGSSSETKMTLVDLNGDGLNDKVYVKGDKVYFCRQHWSEDDSSFYFDTPAEVKGIHHIMRSSSRSNTFGVQASLYVSAGANWTDAKSTTSTYFADVNGDGYVDLVDGGQVYFNHCEKGGVPVFKRYSTMPTASQGAEEAEVSAIVDTMDAACGDIIFDGAANDSINCRRVWVLLNTFVTTLQDSDQYIWLNAHLEDTMYMMSQEEDRLKVEVYHREWDCSYHDDSPAIDAVRVWIAPRNGNINITSRVQLREDTTLSRSIARHADGVVLSIQKTSNISPGHNNFNPGSVNTHLHDILIDSTDYAMHTDSRRRDSVEAGDMIFFRLRSKSDRHFDDVYARFTIDYADSSEYADWERYKWHFDSQEDFVLSGDYYFQAPVDGSYQVHLRWTDSTGGVSAVLEQNESPVFSLNAGIDTIYTSNWVSANKDDSIRVELVSSNGSSESWGRVRCSPYITFVPVDGAERYGSVYHAMDSITLDTTTFSVTDTIRGWLMPHVNFTHHDAIHDTPFYRRLFGPLYKGWGQFAYRSEGVDDDLILIEKLVPSDMMVSGDTNAGDRNRMNVLTSYRPDTSSFGQSESMEDFQSSNWNYYSPYSSRSNWVEMTPDAEHWVWVGYGHQNTVGRDMTSNSLNTDWYSATPVEESETNDSTASITAQVAVHDDPVPPARQGTPAKAVNKVNRSKSRSWSVGFIGAGVSYSRGDNTIETEYLDLNGDRYPDIIGTDMVQYSQQWGGVGPVRPLNSALSHGSASHTWSDGMSYSASKVTQERTSCSLQQNAFFTMHSEGSGSVSGGGNIGYDEAGGSWVDMNGDGLPDFVYPRGHVRMNIGYGFVNDFDWDFTKVRNGVSGAISVGAGLQYAEGESVTDLLTGVTNISQASIEAGAGMEGSYNQTTHMLMDINGDGLPDMLWREICCMDSLFRGGDVVKTMVRYNLGAGRFSGTDTLDIGRFHSSASFSESLNAGFTYGFTLWGTYKITLGLNGCPYNASVTQDYVQLADVNADGLPDWIYSRKENEMVVRYNLAGRTNLLRKVTNFNGADFQMEYTLSEASYKQPSRSWLMTGVTTHDALNGNNGATTTVTEYAYAGPHYDRYERTSYGYDTVITSQVNPTTGAAYRTVERNYYNNNMLRRGKIRREMTRDGYGNPYVEKLHECTYIDYTNSYALNVDTLCPVIAYPSSEATFTKYYEGNTTPQLVVGERFEYDRYHNIVRYVDLGDTADHSDGLEVDFHYFTGLANNLISLRKDYEVTSTESSAILRKARFEYDIAHGKMTRQVMNNGPDSAVYDFTYDTLYGNLVSAMRPQNATGGRMTFRYAYDSVVHTYPTMVADSYGDTVTTVYDCRFWKPLAVTDPTGSTMTYRYDFAGRLVSVTSPLNTSGTPSLVNEYHPVNYYRNGFSPQGFSYNESPTHHPYAVSLHYDDNGSLITATAVLTNGFGQAIQTKKGLRAGNTNMMQVSGRTVVDAFGRTVEQYDPVAEPRTSHWGQYNTGYSAASLTTIEYDVLDRTTRTVQPLGVTTTTAYSIDDDRRFVTAITDPNNNVTTQYADYEGRRVKVSDAAGGTTQFAYDALGQLISSTDPEDFPTQYSYDNLGRIILRDHPDAGVTLYTYDPAGNLITETNPLGQISYGYTYYRPLYKRYSYMTGNNVTYTYGTSGTSKGRPILVTDGTGSLKLAYDALGNVTMETRVLVLPNSHEEFRVTMKYGYDSWGRMLTMIYPDAEEVYYSYQWGGDLNAMHGEKNGILRTYIREIVYNSFGQKENVRYGNGTRAYYTYDALHRLAKLQSIDSLGNYMQDIAYTFDNASNVTGITNNAGAVNTLGGTYGNTYAYDALHRLVGSSGSGTGEYYDMVMTYLPSGRIRRKNRYCQSSSVSGSANMYYGYCDEFQPHAVRRIYDEYSQMHYDLRWDAAGNLGQISTGNAESMFESGRFLFWTEDNRMHVAVDNSHYSYYAYDHSGERRIKLTGENSVLDVNAEIMSTLSTLDKVTLYPSAYVVLTDRGYTKHYYTGMERIAARIGDGGLNVGIYLSDTDSLHARADRLFGQSLDQVNCRVLDANEMGCILDGAQDHVELGILVEEIPERMLATVGTEYGEFISAMHLISGIGESSDVYYYHSDHLGSASWITDSSGIPVQHLQYMPFGEPFVNQRISGYSERFTFTGNERDEETGYGYFGARYMDHELMTMWLSVDPMSDKYPSISPFAYCAWNPVKLVDPDGREVSPCDDEAYEMILNTIPPEARAYVQRNSDGYIDKNLINSFDCESSNYRDLKELVNMDDCIIEVSLANNYEWADNAGGINNSDMFYSNPELEAAFLKGLAGSIANFDQFESPESVYILSTGETGDLGVCLRPTSTSGKRSTNGNIQVYINDKLSTKGRAENFAHEFFGHAYIYAKTRDAALSEHDTETNPGTDSNILLKNRIINAQNEAASYNR